MSESKLNVLIAKVFGAVLVLVGILGFFVGTGTLILFGVNPLHSFIHLASGLFLLAAAYVADGKNAATANKTLGIVYILVAVLGFAGILIPSLLNTDADAFAHADNLLHSLVALVLVVAGFGALGSSRRAKSSA